MPMLHGFKVLFFTAALSAVVSSPVAERATPEDVTLPEVGDFLVAARDMRDPNFSESVVLVTRFDEEGATGLIVNRPLEVSLHERFPEIRGLERYDGPLFRGGPVELGYALLVHGSDAPEGTRRILDDVHLGSSREVLARLAATAEGRKSFRLYAGNAGWAAGQLEWELGRGGWRVVPGDSEIIFSEDVAAVWERLQPRSRDNWVERRVPFTLRPAG
jgi:putative transcriptional regulator